MKFWDDPSDALTLMRSQPSVVRDVINVNEVHSDESGLEVEGSKRKPISANEVLECSYSVTPGDYQSPPVVSYSLQVLDAEGKTALYTIIQATSAGGAFGEDAYLGEALMRAKTDEEIVKKLKGLGYLE